MFITVDDWIEMDNLRYEAGTSNIDKKNLCIADRRKENVVRCT